MAWEVARDRVAKLQSLWGKFQEVDNEIANLEGLIVRTTNERSGFLQTMVAMQAQGRGEDVLYWNERAMQLRVENENNNKRLQDLKVSRDPILLKLGLMMQSSQFWRFSIDELEQLYGDKDSKKRSMDTRGSHDQDQQMLLNDSTRALWLIGYEIEEIKLVLAYKQHSSAPGVSPVLSPVPSEPRARVVMMPAEIVELKEAITLKERSLQRNTYSAGEKTLIQRQIYDIQVGLETALEKHLASWEDFVKRTEGNMAYLHERISKMLDIPNIKSELESVRQQVKRKYGQQQLEEQIQKLVLSIESLNVTMRENRDPTRTMRYERDRSSKLTTLQELRRQRETL